MGVSVVASVEGPAFSSLASIASESMVGLVIAGASGGHPHSGNPIHGAVLQALMPVILMATGKPDVPPRYRLVRSSIPFKSSFRGECRPGFVWVGCWSGLV